MSESQVVSSRSPRDFAVALGALGVVFGDIGTSPLYALRACLTAGGSVSTDAPAVLGVLSLVFWALGLTITAKYLMIVLRTDNRGEGGVLALTALALSEGPWQRATVVTLLGLAGCALFYGDGIITPAVTVLSAIEGLEVVAPQLERIVIPVSIAILLALFVLQKRGTGTLGKLFGPVMLIWFLTLGLLGVHGIVANPGVLAAMSPHYAVAFIPSHSAVALLVVGAVFLAVTGGEALYADLGHFGVRPIRIAWFFVAWPALVLNYFGQGADLLRDPAAIFNPLFHLAPTWFVLPLVVLATLAAIIASQAVISGVFSMSQQALQLGFLPRIRVVQCSADAMGQIYVPLINWLLCSATIMLVLSFGSSSNLANAYGIAVASTMVIETSLLLTLLRGRVAVFDRLFFWFLLPLAAIDMAFFVANVAKIPEGGWVPLLVAAGALLVMRTWTNGRVVVSDLMRREGRTDARFLARVAEEPPARVSGVAVFLTSDATNIPRTLVRNVQHNGVLHEKTILLTIATERVPRLVGGSRVSAKAIGSGLYRVVAHIGFMDSPNVPRILRDAERRGLGFDTQRATYFLGRDDVVIGNRPGMATWRKQLFLFMTRNAQFAAAHFGIPPQRVIEVGGQVEI
ncbi:MAG: potassium transporter Kup [Steroidobacteraceae bacterium]|nr:potassium transporter Kup [Steroidobacteraceae bacterium]